MDRPEDPAGIGVADDPSALCVLIDVSPRAWAARPQADLAILVDHLLVFANAFHLLSASNRLVLLCVHPSTVRFAWPPADARAVQPQVMQSSGDVRRFDVESVDKENAERGVVATLDYESGVVWMEHDDESR